MADGGCESGVDWEAHIHSKSVGALLEVRLGSIWNPFGVHVDALTATEGSWASLGRSECDQQFVLSNLAQHGKKRSMKEARFSKITDTYFVDFCSQSPPCHMKDAWGVLGWSPSCAGLLEGS